MTPTNPLSFGLMRGLAEPARTTRETLSRLGQELATGESADPSAALNHDFSALGLITRDLDVADSLRTSIDRGKRFTAAAQAALQGANEEVANLRDQLVPLVSGGSQISPDEIASMAEAAFENLVGYINTRQDGGAVFAAGRADANAVDDAASILSGLRASMVGATGPDDIRNRVEAFFAPGGDYDSNHVTIGTPDTFGFRTDSDTVEAFGLRADDAEVAQALSAVGTLLAVAESPFSNGSAGQLYLATQSTGDLATAQEKIITLAGQTGRVEARLQDAETALGDSLLRAQQARADLISADPYETASRIQEETARLETIYTLTARLSRLRLTDYL